MILIFFYFLHSLLWAQELEVSTDDIQAYARVKNCIDFYLCHPYQESLRIISGRYFWKAKFSEPLTSIKKAFENCSIENSEAEVTAIDSNGNIQKDFLIPRGPQSFLTKKHLLPMELNTNVYYGLRKKELIMDKLLNQRVLDLAMKSTSFEFEYGLGEYVLKSGELPPNVLGQTDHLFKTITYDPEKYDGKICRYYQVMRHEIQHVRNWREKDSCREKSQTHHFRKNNYDEISTYLNDLVFLKKYCPYEVEIFNNTQAMLLAMYENKKLHLCSGGAERKQHGGTEFDLPSSPATETYYFPQKTFPSTKDLFRKTASVVGRLKKIIYEEYDYDESKPYGFRKKKIPENPRNLR